MDRRNESRRKADLAWLYGTDEELDHTRVLDESEQAELLRRRSQTAAQQEAAARTGAQAAQSGTDPSADPTATSVDLPPQRVVHTEPNDTEQSLRRTVRDAQPAPRPEPTTAPRPAPRPTPSAAPAARKIAAATRTGSATVPPQLGGSAAALAGGGRRRRPLAAGGRRRRHGRPPIVRILLGLLAAWLVWLLVVPAIGLSRMPRAQEAPDGTRPANQPGTLTLMIGSDQRDNLTAEQKKQLGTGSEEGKRTDTMMLLFQPKSGQPALVSLPRDSYVAIPGHGHNKLNAAYSLGGADLLVETIEQDTGLRIDNYLEIGFDGFSNVIDALGGIRMCLPNAIKDKDSHIDLPAGCQNLDGVNALGYVRMRKADPTGDIGRTKRQRQMVSAVAKKALSPMTFINPVRYWNLSMTGGQAVTRGQDTSLIEVASALNTMRGISDSGLTLTVPLSSTDTTTAAGSSVIWDETESAKMFATMASGTTNGLEQYAK